MMNEVVPVITAAAGVMALMLTVILLVRRRMRRGGIVQIVPLLLLERRLGSAAQFGVGVQLFRQPRPAPGVVNHFRSGQLREHLGHIIGGDKAVAQHEDSHGAAPYSFFSLFSTAIIHGSAERNKAGRRRLAHQILRRKKQR